MSNPLDDKNLTPDELTNEEGATSPAENEEGAANNDSYVYDESEFAGSTIFSAPDELGQSKPPKKGSRKTRNLIAAILMVCILAAAVFAIVKLIPAEGDETESSSVMSLSVNVVSIPESDISSITITNADGTYTAYPSVEEVTTSSGTGEDTVWYIDGIGTELINTTSTDVIATSALNITATRLMEENAADLSLYGLDSPVITVEVKSDTAQGYTLYLGGDSPTADGKYARLEGSFDVYLIGNSTVTSFSRAVTSFVNYSMFTSVESNTDTASYFNADGELEKFEYVEISGTNFDAPIRIEMNPYDASSYIPYLMTSPVRQNVMGEVGDAVKAPIKTGLMADGVYEVYPDEATLREYGFDNPQIVVNYKVATYTKTLRICESKANSEYYAVMFDEQPVIYMVEKSTLAFASYEVEDYFNNYIFLDDITTIKSITVTTEAGTHVYNLTHGVDENEEATMQVECGGAVLDQQSFRNLYQYMISCYSSEFTMEAAPAGVSAGLEITIDYIDDARDSIVASYVKATDRRYHIAVNGTPLGYAYLTTVDSLISYENGYHDGGSVPKP